MKKSDIRKRIFKIRKEKSSKNLKVDLNDILKILKKEKIKRKILGGYYPFNYETDPLKVLDDLEKRNYQVSLPKINNNSQMDFFKWSSKDPLSINKYGIPEPLSNKILYPNILLVPLVAFDKNFNRVGYGGGFYDRYIKRVKKNNKVLTIGLAYTFQKVKVVQTNKYDVKLDYVVTCN